MPRANKFKVVIGQGTPMDEETTMNQSESESAQEWELSKENIQPLRSGRNVNSMTAGLQLHNKDEITKKIKEEKLFFETELRTYTGDDPLDVWDRYVKWMEQTFLKGGRDSKMTTLLERCIIAFKDDARYTNDHRYVDIWIKFINFCTEPLEMYSYMFDQGIGCEVAALYENWAWALEQTGNTKRADCLFQEGLSRGAQPLDRLAKSHQEFQARVARSAMCGSSAEEEKMEVGEQRTALGLLKPQGKKHSVGVSRTGPALQAPKGLGTRPALGEKQAGVGFQIFTDENNVPSRTPQQTGEWTTVPRPVEVNRENEQKAGVWTKAKVPQKTTGVVPISSLATKAQPGFTVHIDKDQEMETPRKGPVVEPHVLSARKADKQPDPLEQVKRGRADGQTEDGGVQQRLMYCKDKIYTGVEEFSLEEIRAARYFKHKAKVEKQQRLHEMQETILNQQRELLQARSEMARMQQMVQQCVSNQEELRHLFIFQHDRVAKSCQTEISAQHQAIERTIESHLRGLTLPACLPRHNRHQQSALALPSSSLPEQELAWEDGVENLPPSHSDSGCTSRGPPSAETSLNARDHTPSFHGPSPQQLSGSSSSLFVSNEPTPSGCRFNANRRSLAAPSPTVHTKEAMQMVMGMFNSSLESDRSFIWPQGVEMGVMKGNSQPAGVTEQSRRAPFTIYSECEDRQLPQGPVEDDKENHRPSGNTLPGKRHGQLMVLQDSKDVPVDPHGKQDIQLEEPIAETEKTEAILSQAQFNEQTIALVGSHESFNFAAAARFASTPFSAKSECGAGTQEMSSHSSETALSLHTIPLNSSSGTPGKKILSPIMEGSQESSSEESKSTATTSRLHGVTTQPSLAARPEETLPLANHSTPPSGPKTASPSGTISRPTETHDVVAASLSTKARALAAPGSGALRERHADGNMEMGTSMTCSPSPSQKQHVIDVSGYVLPDYDEQTEAIMNQSIRIDPQNPFDEETIAGFLNTLKKPLSSYDNYIAVGGPVPKVNFSTILGVDKYNNIEFIGEGGFAKVYRASLDDFFSIESEDMIIKVQKPACPWEFYMSTEVHRRLAALQAPMDVRPSVVKVKKGYFFSNGSCLVTNYLPSGTLLDLVNKIKARERSLLAEMEPLAVFLTIEMLHIVEKLHSCQIIHGDIKPDNFLLIDLPFIKICEDPAVVFGSKTQCLQLIDFGNSIDLKKFPPGTTFMAKVKTQGFQCIEMMTDRPWTYQTDLFGLLGTVHVLVFGEYMKVYQQRSQWNMTSSFPRKWNVPLWKKFFRELLNVPSCSELPDLTTLRQEFQDYLMASLLPNFNTIVEKAMFIL